MIGLSACSLYQSPGRKFLEKQAFEFAGVDAQANLLSCQHHASQDQWVLMSENGAAYVFAHEAKEFELRVVPLGSRTGFSCDYRFASAQEMFEKTAAAVDLTLMQSKTE